MPDDEAKRSMNIINKMNEIHFPPPAIQNTPFSFRHYIINNINVLQHLTKFRLLSITKVFFGSRISVNLIDKGGNMSNQEKSAETRGALSQTLNNLIELLGDLNPSATSQGANPLSQSTGPRSLSAPTDPMGQASGFPSSWAPSHTSVLFAATSGFGAEPRSPMTDLQGPSIRLPSPLTHPLNPFAVHPGMLPWTDRLSELTEHAKSFLRRPDLTPEIRAMIGYIASMAKIHGGYGIISSLARQYDISRTFVYMLAASVEETTPMIFGSKDPDNKHSDEKKLALSYMLSLRFEGQCSIGGIHTILDRIVPKPLSHGSISQHLRKFGALTPNTLTTDKDEVQYCVFASDEIFAESRPVLITVDPVSSAILGIESADSRKAEIWKEHWRCLVDNGYAALYLVCDEGSALAKGQKDSECIEFKNSDTYHAIAHRLGKWVSSLLKSAESAIEKEADRIRQFDSAKTPRTMEKRFRQWEEALKIADEKIELYETFSVLYECLVDELQVFDCNGKLRARNNAEENIKTELDLLEELGHEKITEAVGKVRRCLPNLLNYFDVAKDLVDKLEKLNIDQEALRLLCLAHQWGKGAIKAKKTNRKRYCIANEQLCLEMASGYLQEEYEDVKELVYKKLDGIVQSSAIVECVNSIVRSFLNTSRNQITQETLNLIMFYHNHRRYKAGKRVGKTPMEILTGKVQKKDWIEMLFDLVEEKDPSFFSSSK